jgi:capsule polysaccharide export protein KpsE/RkpR
MIEVIVQFKTSDGRIFDKFEDAQKWQELVNKIAEFRKVPLENHALNDFISALMMEGSSYEEACVEAVKRQLKGGGESN